MARLCRPALRLVLAGVLGLLVACGGPGYDAGGPHWDADGIRFDAPTGWYLRASSEARFPHSARLFYLATQPLAEDCRVVGAMEDCRLPVQRLEEGGLLLVWGKTLCAGPGCGLPAGSRTQVGGREAVMVDPGDWCDQIGQTDASAWLVQVSPQRLDWIGVCTRNASARTMATLRALLAAVDWRTP